MGLRDIKLKLEYRSPESDMAKDFYIPLLKNADLYRRSIGFFSSASLLDISIGIADLARRGGHIQMIASPRLSEEDIDAIDKGYAERNALIEKRLLEGLDKEYTDYFSVERLNLLANLIANGTMEFKIAIMEKKVHGKIGMYHEKLGLISNGEGDTVSFSGSMNESDDGLFVNYEVSDIFTSWKEPERIDLKVKAFERMWNEADPNVKILDFPSVPKKLLEKYKKKEPDFDIDEQEYFQYTSGKTSGIAERSTEYMSEKPDGARMPKGMNLYDYQQGAIDKWKEAGYIGIYDMATGSGKTLTGLGSIARISEDLNDDLTVIILCPYQHLVDQWVEDIVKFNMHPIIGYSTSPQKDWKIRFKNAVQGKRLGIQRFLSFICTNATFRTKFVQEQLSRIKGPVLLVVDEAHNAGAAGFMKYLDDRFKYRLALSATLDRHMDPEGTKILHNYFGEACIHYSLDQAIRDEKLTHYLYYTVVVNLNEEELEAYNALTKEIGKNIVKGKNGKTKLSAHGKLLAIKRAHLVAGAAMKLDALRKEIGQYKDEGNILVYCGATNVMKDNEDESETDEADIKQIQAVTSILGNEFGMSVAEFTAEEPTEQRRMIKERFMDGDLQAIAAIKCLDEGMNIPGIKTAFILASSTNPKEYIQRRGRVLRTAPGKIYARIYDFVTLPRPLENAYGMTEEEKNGDRGLIINEIRRMKEFASSADNSTDTDILINELQDAYNLQDKDIEGEDYE